MFTKLLELNMRANKGGGCSSQGFPGVWRAPRILELLYSENHQTISEETYIFSQFSSDISIRIDDFGIARALKKSLNLE